MSRIVRLTSPDHHHRGEEGPDYFAPLARAANPTPAIYFGREFEMRITVELVPLALLAALPLWAVAFGWGLLRTALALAAIAGARQYLLLSKVFGREEGEQGASKKLVLQTHAMSHFVEKVRWCMDMAGIPYQEEQVRIGIFYMIRSCFDSDSSQQFTVDQKVPKATL